MKKMPEEFNQFCTDRCLFAADSSNEYDLAKEAWNRAIEVVSDIVAEIEHVDYNIYEDYTVVD